ncbi:MAG: phosphate acetyltransferase [Nitrospira sp.]|nr:phosphate acetyltransferase [Nitrospira sp.]
MIRKQEALEYHSGGRRGKIEITPTKPTRTQRDLALAYSPGVAAPCLEIYADPENVFNYTIRGNLVAVVTNGTAVLGLGNIGPMAAKPVMEGKAVLFKRFADIDVFDLEVGSSDPDEMIRVVQALEPTFGGINLEDIKAPDCFYIEEKLRESMNIPVFHDDQHGTAIITAAALLNALEVADKDISKVRVVYNGAGAAGIACAELFADLGVRRENMIMCDSAGVIYKGREQGMNPYKARLASDTSLRTLADAMKGTDVFIGVSVAGVVTRKMVASMNERPIIMAMANPDPEITYEDAKAAQSDVIMATGRSDYPNMVNNVLGFPFIFRGALDVRARRFNEEMKIAAVHALANLAKRDVPDSVMRAYGIDRLRFGPEYIIPKPFDPRVLTWVSPAVAQAAMDSGVARIEIDMDEYRHQLASRLGRSREVMGGVIARAKKQTKRIVFPEGEEDKILRASQVLIDENIARPILLGRSDIIEARIKELDMELSGVSVVSPRAAPQFDRYVDELYKLRNRRGVTLSEARVLMADHNVFGSMMVNMGDADAMVAGLTQHYSSTIRPALQIIRTRPGTHKVAGVYMMIFKNDVKFFADTTVNIEPTAEDLAEIAIEAAEVARRFNVEPRVAMLSFSNFGSTHHPLTEKVRLATELVRKRAPALIVDGEMQADTAVVEEILTETYPFSTLKSPANVLVFPTLDAGNIAYKLMQRLGGAEAIGPILTRLRKPVHVLQRGAEVDEIINMAAIAAVEAQEEKAGR